jgi:chromosome segregation ATPase
MQRSEKVETVEDVRRSARKALSRLSRTFAEWESRIATLKADLADQESIIRQLRDQAKGLPSDEQMDFLNGKIEFLIKDVENSQHVCKLAEENRDNWRDESSRLQKELQEQSKEVSRLEKKLKGTARYSDEETALEIEKLEAELESKTSDVREQMTQVDRLRDDLTEQRKRNNSLQRKIEELNEELAQKEKNPDKSGASPDELKGLRAELEQAQSHLDQLIDFEEKYHASESVVDELKKKMKSHEFNNRALKNGTDLLRREKANFRQKLSDMTERLEEARVKVRDAEAHVAKARAGEKSVGENTLSLSAIQSRDIRFQVQNEELRIKLGNQRNDLDNLQAAFKNNAQRYKDLKARSEAQLTLIDELQGDIDKHNREKAGDRKDDVQASQLKAELEEKQKMIDNLQIEILNQKNAGAHNLANLQTRDATQTFKLNKRNEPKLGSLGSKSGGQELVADLKKQLEQKDAALETLRKSLADLRNRYQSLASKDRLDKTVAMPRPDVTESETLMPTGSGDSTADTNLSDTEIVATNQIRRPVFD